MKKAVLAIILVLQVLMLYPKSASVNIRFLFLTHPDFRKFDFSVGMFKEFEDILNKEREEFARYEKIYLLIAEQQSQLKQKLENDIVEARAKKWNKKKIQRLQKKFDNTFTRLNKKNRAIERKLDQFSQQNSGNIQEKASNANLIKFKKIHNDIIRITQEYVIKNGYNTLINTSVWRLNINEFNQKYRLFPTMHNTYSRFFKLNDKKSLDKWISEGVMICSKKMMFMSDFILYGGDDITFKIFYKLRNRGK